MENEWIMTMHTVVPEYEKVDETVPDTWVKSMSCFFGLHALLIFINFHEYSKNRSDLFSTAFTCQPLGSRNTKARE